MTPAGIFYTGKDFLGPSNYLQGVFLFILNRDREECQVLGECLRGVQRGLYLYLDPGPGHGAA